jgi:putative ABC transport system ATP-binding protein
MLKAIDLHRSFSLGGQEVRAVDGVTIEVRKGEYLRVVGASGSGKSTLLNLLAGLDRPTAGRVETPIGELGQASSRALAGWRARHVGMVFQTFNLLSHLTAVENVELGLLFLGRTRAERRASALDTLNQLGLSDRLHHKPGSLSGGEQQRVALARALVKAPEVLLADEPTGNLDRDNAVLIADLLALQNRSGTTVVLVTHDPTLASDVAHRTVRLSYGRISETIEHRPLAHTGENGGAQ